MVATLVSRQRASGLDRCAYSGGPAPEVRGRLFLPMAGPWLLGRGCAGRRRYGEAGGLCECPTHGRGLRSGRVRSARAGTSLCGRGRSTPSGTGILSPYAWAVPGWSGPHPAARNVPAGIWDAVVRGRRGSARSVPVPPVPGGAALGSSAGRCGTRAVPIRIKDPWVTNQIYFWYI